MPIEMINVTTKPAETVTVSREEYDAQLATIADLKAYVTELETKLSWLTEQVRLSRVRRFGSYPETAGQEVLEQMSLLFNEAARLEKSVVREHERRKRSGSLRDVVPKNITVQ